MGQIQLAATGAETRRLDFAPEAFFAACGVIKNSSLHFVYAVADS
jgi:hypothetical protein